IVCFEVPCWNTPPECSLVYAGLSLTCVMTDLQIKHVSFLPSGEPQRAEVTVTLKEQTFAAATIVDFIGRHVDLAVSFTRYSSLSDVGNELAIISPTLFGVFD